MNGNKGVWKYGTLAVVTINSISGRDRLVEEDVDADPEKANREGVRLGSKRLFSEAQLKPLRGAESASRRAVRAYSVEFPVGHLRFVTWELLPRVTSAFEAALAEHKAAVETLKKNFTKYRDEMIEKYPDQLSEANYWRTLELLKGGYCQVRLTTATLDLTGESKAEESSVLTEFATEAIRDLRETIGSAATRVAQRLSEDKPISEKSLNALRRLVEKAQLANFVNDPVTARSIAALSTELDGREAKVMRTDPADSSAFRRALEVIATEVDKEANIGRLSKRFVKRVIEIEDERRTG